MTLAALQQHDERLRTVCAPVSRTDLRGRQQQQEIDDLLEFMYGRTAMREVQHDSGLPPVPATVGLSANQVGIMKRICLADLSIGRPGYHDVRVFINPRIVWASRQMAPRVEGCVNFAELWGITQRPVRIKVEAFDRSGFASVTELTGWAAALLCHEVDHINGHLFIDRLEQPGAAHVVHEADYPRYRKNQFKDWTPTQDVSELIRAIHPHDYTYN